jgi:3-deoxy-7-phosphoheptulonate synthase
MRTNSKPASESAYGGGERTSRTDDLRIENVTPLPPPEHLIRFFPIAGTPVEQQIGTTRDAIRRIMRATTTASSSSWARARSTTRSPRSNTRASSRPSATASPTRDARDRHARLLREAPHDRSAGRGLINDPYLDETYRIDEGCASAASSCSRSTSSACRPAASSST